jgi:ribonuclease-3
MEETTFELIDPPSFPRSEIERLIGTKMKNENVYIRAFTHKSALKKYKGLEGSYETLEFMGDSVLGFIITKFLFDRFEDRQEGFLTKARTKLVRGKTLCEIAERLQLQRWILMDDKGIRNGWNTNANILEDVFEALVGAIYMDLGIIHAKTFVFSAFQSIFDSIETSLMDDNYKDQLMRWCQANKISLPEYVVKGQYTGTFHIEVLVEGVSHGAGFGKTKKEAEQNAAYIALSTTPRFKNESRTVKYGTSQS